MDNKYTFKGIENQIEKLDEKVDKLDEKIQDIGVVLTRNTSSLEEHMRRSLANEEAIQLMRQQIKPIESHVASVHTVLKIFGFLGLLASLGAGLVKIIQFFAIK